MMKRVFPFLVVVLLILLTACGSSSSPEKKYAAGLQPAIPLLTKWQTDYTDLETLLTGPVTASSDLTRLQMMDLYNVATEYKITREDYVNMGFEPLDNLVGPSTKLAKDGHAILDILSAITPVQETQADHQVVLQCVQTRIAFAEELSSSIKELNSVDMSKAGALSNCESFEASLEKLAAYVNNQK